MQSGDTIGRVLDEWLGYRVRLSGGMLRCKDLAVSDVFSKEVRSRVMSAVRSRGNRSTEAVLLAALRVNRLTGWRRHYKITGRPDFAFPKSRLAVFLDGCFWHGCPRCGTIPASNRLYWVSKISGNTRRDRRQNQILRAKGWHVLRVWEHDLRPSRIPCVVNRIRKALARSTGTVAKSLFQ
jgi:DNA mismatch endonuclease (patch repair protein)